MSKAATNTSALSAQIFAVMGRTGAGKSTLINKICGKNEVEVGYGLQSYTAEVKVTSPITLDKREVYLIDTPGFDDTMKDEAEILTSIAQFFSATYEAGTKVNGVLFLHQISDTRVGGVARKNFRLFRKICGTDAMKRVLIVTTMWERVPLEEATRRETELAESELFFKTAVEHGAQMVRHDGTEASARNIIRRLIGSPPEALGIQIEMVEEKKDVAHTAAGQDLQSELEALKKKHEAKIKAVKEEMEQLIAVKDQKHREEIEELEAALRDVRGKVEKIEKANEYLRKEHTTEASCLQELAKRLAEDIKEREKLRLFLERAEIREAWTRDELKHATQTRRSSNLLMTAVGCALGAGALVVTQDMNLAMRIATSVAKTTFGQNTTSSMEDYLPKAFR